jgi:hypothetical protein
MFTNAGVLDSPTCALTCLSLSSLCSLCSLCSLSDSCVRVLACFAYFCVFLRAGQALSTYATGYSEYAAFESMLARESQGNTCCDGWVCETNNLNVSGQNAICSQQSQQDGVDIFLDDSDGGIPTHSSPPPPTSPAYWTKFAHIGITTQNIVLSSYNTALGSQTSNDTVWWTSCSAAQTLSGKTNPAIMLTMGSVVDYFRPMTGYTLCEMLSSSDKHDWSNDGVTWVTPTHDFNPTDRKMGGSRSDWPRSNVAGDDRTYLSFWGHAWGLSGCCHNTIDSTFVRGYKTFDMYVDTPPPPPPPPSPPSPPSPPPPPPPPPPLPMVREVRFVVSVAGDISSFNSTKFEENVAIAAGVSLSCVELNITAASIKVTAIIRPEYNSSVTAEDVQENLEIAFNSSTTTASDVLGVTVEEISTAPEIYNNDSPPTPPSFPPDEEGSGWLTVALLLVFLSACCAFCAVLRKLSRAKNVSSGDNIPLIQRAKKRAKKRDVPPFRGERP